MVPTILGCHGLWEPSEQGCHNNDVLACLGKVWEGSIVFDDPLVHIAGHGARTPTVPSALDLLLKLYVLLL